MAKKRQSKVRENVKLLVTAYPACAENYNMLITKYWAMFNNVYSFSDVAKATSSESITRALRELIRTGEVAVSKERYEQTKQLEAEFREEYSQGPKQSYLDFTSVMQETKELD